jgi:hypothetical protein
LASGMASRCHRTGSATAAKMERLGIRTGKRRREVSLAFLTEHFRKAGSHFHAIARGEDHRPVLPDRPRKSAGSEAIYPRDLETPDEVEAGRRRGAMLMGGRRCPMASEAPSSPGLTTPGRVRTWPPRRLWPMKSAMRFRDAIGTPTCSTVPLHAWTHGRCAAPPPRSPRRALPQRAHGIRRPRGEGRRAPVGCCARARFPSPAVSQAVEHVGHAQNGLAWRLPHMRAGMSEEPTCAVRP